MRESRLEEYWGLKGALVLKRLEELTTGQEFVQNTDCFFRSASGLFDRLVLMIDLVHRLSARFSFKHVRRYLECTDNEQPSRRLRTGGLIPIDIVQDKPESSTVGLVGLGLAHERDSTC
ncbi:MAG: hypothetical protein AAFU77_17750 [Myxococcota bacterium]